MTVTHTISKTRARVGETVTVSTSPIQKPAYGVMWVIDYTTSDNQKSFERLWQDGRGFAVYTNTLSKSITINQSHSEIRTLTPICWTVPITNASLLNAAQTNPIENNEYIEVGETYDVSFYYNLAESIYSLGEKLATNISEKGVSASADDGLTTLANKIDDIYENIPRVIIEDDTVTDFADLRFTFIVPKNCTNIVDWCFAYSKNLKYCILPEGITRIGDAAFYSCKNLQQLEIPRTVTTIGQTSIEYLDSLTTLRFKSVIPPTVQNRTNFRGIPTSCTIEVPQESLSAYESAQYYPDPNTYTYVGY